MNRFQVDILQNILADLEYSLENNERWHTIKGQGDMALVQEALEMVIWWKTKPGATENVARPDTVPSPRTG